MLCPLSAEHCVPRLRSQTEISYVQTVPDKTCLCSDHPRRNVPMSRLSRIQKYFCVVRTFKITYDQTFVRSKPKLVRSNFENLCVHVQTIVRSFVFTGRVILNARYPPCAFISVWHLSLGIHKLTTQLGFLNILTSGHCIAYQNVFWSFLFIWGQIASQVGLVPRIQGMEREWVAQRLDQKLEFGHRVWSVDRKGTIDFDWYFHYRSWNFVQKT